MADEVLGNIYEVLTIVAIEDYTTILKKGETVFWHEHPKGVLIEPDLTIGKDKDQPRLLFQISHTNAESASHHKFWRNIGEFVDARLALGSSTAIVNIVFDSGQKRKLASASKALFDGFLEADRQPYGADLVKLGNRLIKTVGRGKKAWDERAKLVRSELSASKNDTAIVKKLALDIENLVRSSSAFAGNWFGAFSKMQASRCKSRMPSVHNTALRRGLGRLLPIDDESTLRQIVDKSKTRKAVTLPPYFLALKLARNALSKPGESKQVVIDPEILLLVDELTTDNIITLWKAMRSVSPATRQACFSIAQSVDFNTFNEYIVTNFAKLATSKGMKQAIKDCYSNPDRILGSFVGLTNPASYGLWLFDYVMTVIKTKSGKQQGYGYTTLGAESGFRFEIAATAGVVLSPFIQRRKTLRVDILGGIANALAKRLKKIGEKWCNGNSDKVAEFYLRALFEDKIYKLAAFDPLRFLLEKALCTTVFERESRCATYLTSVTGKGSATCDVVKVENTVILWQSASNKGVGHKMKELCGRVGMLRVTTNALGASVPDSRYKKTILLIDGTWTEEHIQRLVDSGIDEIYYPDELDKLIAAIV